MRELCVGTARCGSEVLTVPQNIPEEIFLKSPLDSNHCGASPWPEIPWGVMAANDCPGLPTAC